MKKGWPVTTLGEACEFRGGGTPSKAVVRYWQGNIPWVSPKDMKFEVVSDSIDHVSPEAIDNSATSLIPEGAVLMVVRSGILARTVPIALTGRKLTINQDLKALCPRKGLNSRFLYHLLNGKMETLLGMVSRGATVHRLMTDQIRGLDFALPPLPEQQRIVGILDEAFAGLATATANAEKNLQNARDIFESHLESVFTQPGKDWVEDKLQSLSSKIGSGATPFGGEASYKKSGTSLIRSLNVHDMGFHYEKLAFLDDAQADDLSNVVVQKRDVLLNITGASVARCCLAPEDVLPARVNQHVSIIRPIPDKLDPDFLHYLLISKPYKDQLLQTGEGAGATRQAITKAQIQEFKVAHPKTLTDQKSIVLKLDSLAAETQRLASIYGRKLAALAELKKSLLHHAFTGQL